MYTNLHVNTGGISASSGYVIQTKPLSIPKTTNKLDTSVNIYGKSQSFSTPIKHNHSTTEPSANNNVSEQGHLRLDTLKCQNNNKINIKHRKLPPS